MKKDPTVDMVRNTIYAHGMCTVHDRILVGVSGGPDSVCLLRFLYVLRDELGIELMIGHVHHCLRGTHADADARFVEHLAQQYHLPCMVETIDVKKYAKQHKLSIEEAARMCRYDYFTRLKKSGVVDSIALGHTHDDQAETIIMRIMRGTGLRGLAAIRPVLDYNGTRLIRPMIAITRSDVIQYCKKERLSFKHDETNDESCFTRNKIRQHLLPYLEKNYNPQIKSALVRFAQTAETDVAFIQSHVCKAEKKVVTYCDEHSYVLCRKYFQALDPAISYRLIEKIVTACSVKSVIDYVHWHLFWNDVKQGKNVKVQLDGRVTLQALKDDVHIFVALDREHDFDVMLDCGASVFIDALGARFTCKKISRSQMKLSNNQYSEYMDFHALVFPLRIRNRDKGDKVKPLGMKGYKKVKDYLIDKKVPHYKRDTIALVFSQKELVWVVPYVISDKCKVTKHTKTVVKLTCTYD